jgi:hypothetical protein
MTKGAIVAGVFGAAMWALSFATGAMLVYATGIPGLSGFVTGLIQPFFLVVVIKIVPRFGAFVLAFSVYAILSIPTVLLGPPGVYKILIAVFSGLCAEFVLAITRRRTWGIFLAFITFGIALSVSAYAAFHLMHLPGAEAFEKAFPFIATIYTVETVVGAAIGIWVFRRYLAESTIVTSLMEGANATIEHR